MSIVLLNYQKQRFLRLVAKRFWTRFLYQAFGSVDNVICKAELTPSPRKFALPCFTPLWIEIRKVFDDSTITLVLAGSFIPKLEVVPTERTFRFVGRVNWKFHFASSFSFLDTHKGFSFMGTVPFSSVCGVSQLRPQIVTHDNQKHNLCPTSHIFFFFAFSLFCF